MSGGDKLKVAVLTESRSDYGVYYPLLKALQADERFELQLLVTGMHLSKAHGYTINEIENSFNIAFWRTRPKRVLIQSDILLILGDRRPMLEAAIDAAYQNIPVAHIQGGDVTETIDESCRHAITRFAHLHFPALNESADRLLKMGEEPWRITVVGPLGIYAMPDAEFIPRERLLRDLRLEDKPIILVIQHPVSGREPFAGEQMKDTLTAVHNPDWQPIVIYPNNDLGSKGMIDVIEHHPFAKFKNLPYLQFISLLKESAVIVGNSSCGIVEAPFFGVPVVNIGNRQKGRKYASGIININYGDNIRGAIDYALSKGLTRTMVKASTEGVEKILEVLGRLEINERLLQKRITY